MPCKILIPTRCNMSFFPLECKCKVFVLKSAIFIVSVLASGATVIIFSPEIHCLNFLTFLIKKITENFHLVSYDAPEVQRESWLHFDQFCHLNRTIDLRTFDRRKPPQNFYDCTFYMMRPVGIEIMHRRNSIKEKNKDYDALNVIFHMSRNLTVYSQLFWQLRFLSKPFYNTQ